MIYCGHCGKLIEGGRFCSACGGAIAPDAVAVAAKLRRQRNKLLLIVGALGFVFVVTTGMVVSRVRHAERSRGSFPGDEMSTPVTPQQQPLLPSPAAARTQAGQPQPPPTEMIPPQQNNAASRLSMGSIDPKATQNAFTTLAQNGTQRNPSPQSLRAPSAESTGSDRYPGSQPIEVDANLPDVGVPVASEVYTTSDSVSTVVGYYTQRYSDADVREVNGQKIIAVDRPGATKVIAIGTTGEETRIAILQQAN
jgi:hypothetical protein